MPLMLFIAYFVLYILERIFSPIFVEVPRTIIFDIIIIFRDLVQVKFVPSGIGRRRLFCITSISTNVTSGSLGIILASGGTPRVAHRRTVGTTGKDGARLDRSLILHTGTVQNKRIF